LWNGLLEKMLEFKAMLEKKGIRRVEILPQAHKLAGIK